jgi:hypothetical protein
MIFAVDITNVALWYEELAFEKLTKRPRFEEMGAMFKMPFPGMWLEGHFGNMQFGVFLAELRPDKVQQPGNLYPAIGDVFIRDVRMERACHVASFRAEANGDGALSFVGISIPQRERVTETQYSFLCALMDNVTFDTFFVDSVNMAAAALSFFHCRNISIRHDPTRAKPKRSLRRQIHVAIPSFHVIEIHRGTKKGLSAREFDERTAAEIRAHFVRGHFKKFDGESKLFGKLNGMWFWNFHARGDGETLKSEYRAWPPEGSHRKHCLVQVERW